MPTDFTRQRSTQALRAPFFRIEIAYRRKSRDRPLARRLAVLIRRTDEIAARKAAGDARFHAAVYAHVVVVDFDARYEPARRNRFAQNKDAVRADIPSIGYHACTEVSPSIDFGTSRTISILSDTCTSPLYIGI